MTKEIEYPQMDHPWLKWAGWAKDDPTFEMYLEEIARGRREADERDRADQDEQVAIFWDCS